MAGVCGVWGEMGLPGEEAVEIEVPATMGGTPESCLLEEVDERCKSIDDDIDSDSCAFESLIRWNRVNAAEVAVVRRAVTSAEAEFDVFKRSFLKSSIFRNSVMFSSSA